MVGEHFLSQLGDFFLLTFKIVNHHVAGMPCLKELKPLLLRMLKLGCDDLDLVTALKDVRQRHKLHVDLGRYGLVADLRVDVVGEIQGGGALNDGFLLSLRSEDGYLAAGQVIVDNVQQFKGVHVRIDQYLLDLCQPLVHLAVILADVAFLLVGPVGGDSFLRYVIHPLCPDLDLDPDSCLAHQCAVQRLVAVALGMLHPVSHTIRLVTVDAGYDREHVVALVTLAFLAVSVGSEDYPQGVEVVDLVEGDVLRLHLVPHRVWCLDPFADLEIESRLP